MSVDDLAKKSIEGDALVQLRYLNEANTIHELNAAELAESLQGLTEIVSDLAKAGALGEGPPPEVMVRPFKEGSFTIEAVLEWAQNHPDAAAAITAPEVTAMGYLLRGAFKRLTSSATQVTRIGDGMVTVNWSDGSVGDYPEAAWKELNKTTKRRKRTMQKIMAPLGDEADLLEVRTAAASEEIEIDQDPVEAIATREEYRIASLFQDDSEETFEVFEKEGVLHAANFYDQRKWRISIDGKVRTVIIDDTDYLARVDAGLPVHKGDILQLRVRRDEVTKNDRTTRTWTVLQVLGQKRGSGDLDDS